MEIDDYESDFKFGHWLKERRQKAGFNLKQAAAKSGISEERLNALEMGYAEKGVTYSESKKIAEAYEIPIREFLSRAASNE